MDLLWQVSVGSASAILVGRLVIELFADIAPVPVSYFQTICKEGVQGSLKGSICHKLLPHFAVFLGKTR